MDKKERSLTFAKYMKHTLKSIMSDRKNKILCFEYLVSLLIKWHQKQSNEERLYLRSFSKLKLLKLLFFVAAVDASNENDGLLDIFDNFYAMQHGPVESDVYDAITANETNKYQFTDRSIKDANDQFDFSTLSTPIKNRIEKSLKNLINKNENIILLSAFDLVDLSHKWNCWKISIETAHILNIGSIKMNTEIIKKDRKIFSL